MPVVAVNDLLEVKFFNVFLGQLAINIRHWKVTAITGTSRTTQQIVEELSAFMAPYYKTLMHDEALYYGAGIKRLLPQPASATEFSAAGAGAGVAGPSPTPSQVSGVVTLLTDFSGRSNRGRAYAPFPAEEDTVANTGRPTLQYFNALSTLGAGLRSTLVSPVGGGANSATYSPVIYHRLTGGTTPITGHRANAKWGTQRRRGDYGALNQLPF